MTVVSVMYPAEAGSRFDMEYYLQSHMPLVQERWAPMGLQRWEVLKGSGAPGGEAPIYQVIANLVFGAAKQFEDGVAQHGSEIMGDIPNFTDTQPVIQISEVAS